MANSRFYDTVSFDVRNNSTMLFFANTSKEGDIKDYLLVMRVIEEDFEESLYLEANETQVGGRDLLSEAQLLGNTLTIRLREPAAELDNATELVLTFEETENNLSSMEKGAFRVFGDKLTGGNA